jgi:hypothetical protein
MSTIRVNAIQSTSTTDGGISIDSSGNITLPANTKVGTQNLPSAGPLSNRNLIINGAMQVAQRGTSTTGLTGNANGYPADRFRFFTGSLGTWTIEQSTDAPAGFSKSAKMTCTTGATASAGNYVFLEYSAEAQDLQQLDYGASTAEATTLSFYVKSNKTGTGSVEIEQLDNSNKQFVGTYTINSADTWERKTIAIPADTNGVINDDNGTGLRFRFWLNSGTDYSGGSTTTAWTTYGQTNSNISNLGVGGANSDNWAITGVQLEVGSVATPFEHRSYGDELARCQRYYQHFATDTSNAVYLGMGISAGSTSARMFMPLAVPMRTTPSITENGASADDQISSTYALSSPSVIASCASTVRVEFSTSGMTNGRPIQLQVGTGESITLSAEL